MTLATVFGYAYQPVLLLAGIALMVAGIWLTGIRKPERGPSA